MNQFNFVSCPQAVFKENKNTICTKQTWKMPTKLSVCDCCDNGYAMWVYPVGTEVNPTIISNRANLLLLIVIPLFPAKVPVKELARGERPHIALQITCTSPPLSMHNFQPETADENGHLTTDFWLLAPQKDSFPLLTAFSSGTTGAFKPPAHERPSAAANT